VVQVAVEENALECGERVRIEVKEVLHAVQNVVSWLER
jgi:hypothetical protein